MGLNPTQLAEHLRDAVRRGQISWSQARIVLGYLALDGVLGEDWHVQSSRATHYRVEESLRSVGLDQTPDGVVRLGGES